MEYVIRCEYGQFDKVVDNILRKYRNWEFVRFEEDENGYILYFRTIE